MNAESIQYFYGILKSNSEIYNISIDKIIESMYIYMESKNFFLPIEKANTLEIDTVRKGKDYCVYRVTKTNTDLKIWERINI